MWIERTALAHLRDLAAQRPIVLLTGARQVGKTRLVQRAFPDHRYVSLDLPTEAARADQDPEAFLQLYPPPVVVDEVQYAPGLFRHLKAVVDRDRDRMGQFILTGSQKLPLMSSVSDSLAGRAAILELEGLTWAEIHAARPELSLEDVVVRGGFPELYERPELDAAAWYRAYVATYLERDVRELMAVGSLRDFERLVRAAALRSGSLLNKAELARDVGVSPPTANAWLSVLEASNQVVLLEPWFSNRTKSVVKSPKLYFADSGLCAFLMGIEDGRDLLRVPLGGALWETMVFAQLRRHQSNARGAWSLWFWRDRTREADFLLHRGGRFDLADAKLTAQPSERDVERLRDVAERLPGGRVETLSIFCRTDARFPLGRDGVARPVDDAWPPS